MQKQLILTVGLMALMTLILAGCQGPSGQEGGQVREPLKTVRLHPENHRYLEYQGNPVILVTSAEHYGAVVNLDFDYKLYLETLGMEDFNYTRIFTGTYIEPVDNIFGIEKNTLAPAPDRYLAPWLKENGKYDLGNFNPDFFNRLKDFVKEAEKQGIIVEVTLFTSIYAENAWNLCPFNAVNNISGVGDLPFQLVNTLFNGGLKEYQESYIRKVVRELNDCDNMFYEIQNEPWSDNQNMAGFVNEEDDLVFRRPWQKKVVLANEMAMEWQEWVASVIIDEEASLPVKHLIAQNISNFGYALDSMPEGVSIINFHYALPCAALNNLQIGGVVGLDETGFMPHQDHLYINQAWRIMLSGAGLYNNLDYSFTAGNEMGTWPIPDTNPGWGGPGFRKKLSILKETLEQVPFYEMEVSDAIVESTAPQLRQYGLQDPGEIYLVFLENYGSTELVPDVPASSYMVTWIDVDTGESNEKELSLGDGTAITAPVKDNQVVLMIRKTH